ncbi:MAG: hypothetical protein JOZ32_00165 [Bryobacterales bacterium]|nr:hypothetical protein [Bryobacterales bacterium]
MCSRLPATLLPGPNLASRIEKADAIVVASVVSGATLASGSEVSSDLVLHVDRVLKGGIIPETDVAAHLEGGGYWIVPNATHTAITEKLYGIWFLSSAASLYKVISRDDNAGELYFAVVLLPEQAPAGTSGDTPAASVANELAAALHWAAETHDARLQTLLMNFQSLNSFTTLAISQQFATEKSPTLRVIGIEGLIAANDPEGVKRAAAEWTELSAAADVNPIISSLMTYSNGDDGDAVRALGTLALRDPAQPGLRENAVYALRAIHTKDALPALIALLDHKEDRVRPYALSGLCLFVRNAPAVTPQSVPSMPWLQIGSRTPLLNRETQRYCLLAPDPAADLDAYANFWKSWWIEHEREIEGR